MTTALGSVGLAAVLAIAGCSSSGSSPKSPSSGGGASLTSITLAAQQGNAEAILARIADEAGIFKKNGLSVSIQSEVSGVASATVVVSNSADFGLVPMANGFPAIQKGSKLVYLTGNQKTPSSIFVRSGITLDGSGVQALKALKGKTIGLPALGTVLQQETEAELKEAGVDPGSVHFIAVGLAVPGFTALSRGSIDADVQVAPTELLLPTGKFKTGFSPITDPKDVPAAYHNLSNDGYVTSARYRQAHPAAVQEFCTSLHQAADFLHDKANLPTIEKTFGLQTVMSLSPSDADKAWQEVNSYYTPVMTKADWERMGVYDSGYVPDYATSVDAQCSAS